MAEIIRNEGKVAFALTEKNHGSDILKNETSAVKVENGYLVSGEKWLIGNATQSNAFSVFTRTGSKSGPRAFSILFIEKDKLDSKSYSHLPKIKTHGLRGADISGISLQKSLLPKESVIGLLGSGLELTLKTLQITRTLHGSAALSLGQADTALRVTLDFVLSRKLYDSTVWDIPHAKNTLVEAFLDILTCECLAIAAVRAIHVLTDQMSLFSAIVKSFIPTTVNKLINSLSPVLGARYYLREEHCWGIFQKILRDHAIVSVFDGSTAVTLQAIALQLNQLASYRSCTENNNSEEIRKRLELLFKLEKSLPDFNPQKLELYNRGRDTILQGIVIVPEHLYKLKEEADINLEVIQTLIMLTNDIIIAINSQEQQILTELGKDYSCKWSQSSSIFKLAKNYSILHTASTCLHMWLYNRQSLSSFFAQGEWLVLCLIRLMNNFSPFKYSSHQVYIERLSEEMLKLYRENKLFSFINFQLAQPKVVC